MCRRKDHFKTSKILGSHNFLLYSPQRSILKNRPLSAMGAWSGRFLYFLTGEAIAKRAGK
ncbi:MAG: hypothetical protein CMO06_21265 [Thalassospira sp.]|nr:hypothetical protein [Thalassospira sp.]